MPLPGERVSPPGSRTHCGSRTASCPSNAGACSTSWPSGTTWQMSRPPDDHRRHGGLRHRRAAVLPARVARDPAYPRREEGRCSGRIHRLRRHPKAANGEIICRQPPAEVMSSPWELPCCRQEHRSRQSSWAGSLPAPACGEDGRPRPAAAFLVRSGSARRLGAYQCQSVRSADRSIDFCCARSFCS